MASGHRRHFADPHLLLKTEYNSTATHFCDICGSKLRGLIGYRCNACNFDIHEACADYFKESVTFFAHPWHALTLTRMPSSCVGWICDLCMEECPPGTFVYRCLRCMFEVHPLCTMLPQTIRCHLQPEQHDLCMVPGWGHCSACKESLGVWQYRCGFCRLKLHITCASGGEQGGAAAATRPQTTSTGGGAAAAQSNAAVAGRPSRSNAVAKFLLKTSFRVAIHAATGGLASPVFEMLAASWN